MDLNQVRVREYRCADRASCLSVFDSNVPSSFLPTERGQFEAFLDELPGPYLLLENEAGVVIACGGYAVPAGGSHADFCWGMVERSHQGLGLGRLLADLRLQRIRQDPDITHVLMNTTQHTRCFFEKLGFVTERVTPDGYAPGLHRCDMRLIINRTCP